MAHRQRLVLDRGGCGAVGRGPDAAVPDGGGSRREFGRDNHHQL